MSDLPIVGIADGNTARPAAVSTVRSAPTHAGRRVRALECRVESGGIALPVDVVGQIIEYEVAPLPLPRGAVRGLGLIDGKLVVSLGFGTPPLGRRRTKGVLLITNQTAFSLAFEIVAALSFIEIDAPRASDLTPMVTANGRELAWIDVARIVAEMDGSIVEGGSW